LRPAASKHSEIIIIIIIILESGNLTPQKTYFVSLSEWVKSRLSQTLTRSARTDSNSKPVMQISSPLSLCYAAWRTFRDITPQYREYGSNRLLIFLREQTHVNIVDPYIYEPIDIAEKHRNHALANFNT
jgi:hypothetical protein